MTNRGMAANVRLFVLGGALCLCAQGFAQSSNEGSFDDFVKSLQADFDDFRNKCNEEYATFLNNPWKAFEGEKPVPKPKEEPVPPVVYEDDGTPAPKPAPLPYDEIVPVPQPQPQPKPVEPIKDESPVSAPKVSFTFFGTGLQVGFDRSSLVKLGGVDEGDVSRAWSAMSGNAAYDGLLSECLRLREERKLDDWPYLEMLRAVSESICGKGSNESTLLMAYLFCQSGYKMRLARGGNGTLYMLYASKHHIYDISYYRIDGETYFVYGESPRSLHVSRAAFPREQSLSLLLVRQPVLAMSPTPKKTRRAKRYPDVGVTFSVNKNLMDFYSTYPTSMVGDNFVTRWAMYANTPLDDNVKAQIYPALKSAVSGCGQLEAVNKLLNFVQTGFEYEYDDKVWGGDRAFFAEESLHYPYCDCEDRSILFTHLVRDLLGLRCILIYYPGHLASAVEFTQGVAPGDYIKLGDDKFTVADATYIGAEVGRTMPGMDNEKAKVILLE